MCMVIRILVCEGYAASSFLLESPEEDGEIRDKIV